MGAETNIEWCHHTFQPWIGCAKVSPGCDHCYAEVGTSARIARGRGLELWGANAERQQLSESYWLQPLRWYRAAVAAGERRRVFCASMADVFEDRRDLDGARERLWALIEQTAGQCICSRCHSAPTCQPITASPGLDWLLLTKRPENVLRLVPERWASERFPPNVWVGASIENQEAFDERWEHLRRVPASLLFGSFEPLLGPINVSRAMSAPPEDPREVGYPDAPPPRTLNWLIIGGESGPRARACDVGGVRDLVRQGRAAGARVFVKQLGARPMMSRDSIERRRAGDFPEHEWPEGTRFGTAPGFHGTEWQGHSALLRHPKGGDPAEWPQDLRVREVP